MASIGYYKAWNLKNEIFQSLNIVMSYVSTVLPHDVKLMIGKAEQIRDTNSPTSEREGTSWNNYSASSLVRRRSGELSLDRLSSCSAFAMMPSICAFFACCRPPRRRKNVVGPKEERDRRDVRPRKKTSSHRREFCSSGKNGMTGKNYRSRIPSRESLAEERTSSCRHDMTSHFIHNGREVKIARRTSERNSYKRDRRNSVISSERFGSSVSTQLGCVS
ncbi:hypothetical protein ACHWQZ_G010656 [Mnemiopsis leidyi]